MAFTIPDLDVAGDLDQAVWTSTDIAILVAGAAGIGVLTGCAVTAQVSPDMTLAVAAGTTRHVAGISVIVAAGNVTIAAAHATLPRLDLISVTNAGVKTVTAGTAATEPKPPALPADHVALAMVHVPGGDTAIQTAQIVDKRVVVPPAVSLQPPGYEFAYAEITANVSVTQTVGTSSATTDLVVSGAAVTYDGATIVEVETFFPSISPDTGTAGRDLKLFLYDGTTPIGRLDFVTCQVAGVVASRASRTAKRITPSAGPHTYSVRASVSVGTGTVGAAAGTTTLDEPGFIRVKKV